jgi:hypothetical protein
MERVAVDKGSDSWQLGDEINAVLINVLPVVVLVNTLGIGLGKLALHTYSFNTAE